MKHCGTNISVLGQIFLMYLSPPTFHPLYSAICSDIIIAILASNSISSYKARYMYCYSSGAVKCTQGFFFVSLIVQPRS